MIKKLILIGIFMLSLLASLPASAQLRSATPPFAGFRAADPNCSVLGTLYWNSVSLAYKACTATGTPGTWSALGGGGSGASIGGAVTGATTGSVFFSGASSAMAQDNANFFWDDTNNRLGIGTNSGLDGAVHILADNALVLQSATAFQQLLALQTNGGTQAMELKLDGNNHPNFLGSGGYIFGDANAYFKIFGNNYSATEPATQTWTVVTTKPGHAVFLTASQTADAYQAFDSTPTKIFSVTNKGAVYGGGGAAVASAAAIVPTGNVFHVTGTATITSITATGILAGSRFTIIFDGALTFTDGSNLKLAGNFVTTADDSISLVYDGTNFYETSRSVN